MTEPITDATRGQQEETGEAPPAGGEATPVTDLERESEIAADYIEGLLDVLDLAGDIDMDVDRMRATVSVVPDPDDPTALDALVGEHGEVVEALQELTRLAVAAATGERSRLMLDIARYRAKRRDDLADLARRVVEQVRSAGTPVALDPMTPFERKVVHDTVAEAGLVSESEGEDPTRWVVVRLA